MLCADVTSSFLSGAVFGNTKGDAGQHMSHDFWRNLSRAFTNGKTSHDGFSEFHAKKAFNSEAECLKDDLKTSQP